MSRSPDTRPVYVISVAAELTGMHAQTLRQYDRMGLVSPSRARGGGRRYSEADVERLREVQRLRTVLEAGQRVFAASRRGDAEAVRPGRRPARPSSIGELVLWRPLR